MAGERPRVGPELLAVKGQAEAAPDVVPQAPEEAASAPASGPPARAGRVALTLRIEPELHRRLRDKAYREDTTIQDIILKALTKMRV